MNRSRNNFTKIRCSYLRAFLHGLGIKIEIAELEIKYNFSFFEGELELSTIHEFRYFEKICDGYYRIPIKTECNFERELIELNGEPYEEPECLTDDYKIPLIKREYERYNQYVLQPAEEKEKKTEKKQKEEDFSDCPIYQSIVADLNKILED